jgi:hypothetical protein
MPSLTLKKDTIEEYLQRNIIHTFLMNSKLNDVGILELKIVSIDLIMIMLENKGYIA